MRKRFEDCSMKVVQSKNSNNYYSFFCAIAFGSLWIAFLIDFHACKISFISINIYILLLKDFRSLKEL